MFEMILEEMIAFLETLKDIALSLAPTCNEVANGTDKDDSVRVVEDIVNVVL